MNEKNKAFQKWLLSIGAGSDQTEFEQHVCLQFGSIFVDSDPDVVRWQAINAPYGGINLFSHPHDIDSLASYYSERLILAPLNADVVSINEYCANMYPGEHYISKSVNEMGLDDLPHNSDQAVPEEVLNSFSLPGFPDCELKLKVGLPLILLRNLNLNRRLSNGTRLLLKGVSDHVLWCKIMTGSCVGDEVLIPKIELFHQGYQFPVARAFALTINKAQGQSLDHVSVYLPRPVFGHRQLYMALSHATNIGGLKVSMVAEHDSEPTTRNVVNLDVIQSCSA